MENFVEHRACITPPPASSSSPQYSSPSLSSRAISKSNSKPKVRIIHIFAPEIIKTDVANFRELVQRLTGKPTARDRARRKTKRPRAVKSRPPEDIVSVGGDSPAAPTNRLVEFRRGREGGMIKEEVDEYEEDQVMWVDRSYVHNYGADHHQSYLNAFGDFDGLIQELGDDDEFSFLQNLDHGPAANYDLHGGFV